MSEHICMLVTTINEKETANLKEKKARYIRGLGGKKGKRKMA